MTTRQPRLPVTPGGTTLSGVFTALVTPFAPDGSLDEGTFRKLVERQLAAGVSGLVPCGTTGESPTLTSDERDRLVTACVELAAHANGVADRPTVLAGTGTNDTAASIAATRRAAALGADAALVVAPYYNRPNQAMLEAHYRSIADQSPLPIVVYNVPSRTASNVEPTTLLRLAEHPRIVGVKEASNSLDQIALVCRERPPGFTVMAGDDLWTLPVLALGGEGVVSVASNEIPSEMVELCVAAHAGEWARARAVHERWLPLFRVNFEGAPNPVPVKAALELLGLAADRVRAPLLPLDPQHRGQLAAVLREAGLDVEASPALGAAR